MTTTIAAQLLVKIAADAASLRAEMQSAQNAVGAAMGSIKNSVLAVVGSVGLAQLARAFVQTADSAALLDARLKLVTGGGRDLEAAQKALYDIAQKNSVALAEATQLYVRLSDPVKRLGGGVRETSAIVEAFSSALKVGGASSGEAASAILQFSQAMGSGTLNGGEFNAIAEASPRILKALSEGMNVPIGALKKMGSEGKLTADVVGNALISQLAVLQAEAAKMPDTVGGAFQRLKNDVYVAVAAFDKANGVTASLAQTIGMVTDFVKVVVTAFGEWQKATAGVSGQIDAARGAFLVFGVALEALVLTLGTVKFLLTEAGRELGGLAAMIGAAVRGEFSQVGEIRRQMNADSAKAREEYLRFSSAVLGATDRILAQRDAAKAASAANGEATGKVGQAAQSYATLKSQLRGATDEQKKASDEVRKYISGLDRQLVALGENINRGRELTDAEKEHLRLTEMLRDGKLKLTAAQEAEARAKIDLTAKLQAEIAQRKELEQRQIAAAQHSAKLREAQERETEALAKGNAELRRQNEVLGLSEAQVAAREAAVLRATATDLEWQAANEGGNNALSEQARLLRERAELLEQGVVLKEAKAAREEWEKTTQSINQGLTDALMRAFESGKGFMQAFKDTLVNAFKTMVLQPTIKAILAPVSGALGSVFSGAANASTGGITSGSGLLNALTGGVGKSIGDSVAFGADSLGSWLVNNTGGALNSLGGSLMGSAGSLGSMAGTLGSFIAPIGIGQTVGRMISGGYGIGGSSSRAVNVGTALGAIFGPLGSGIGAALGGVANRLFGMKAPEVTGQGIVGSISGGALSGNLYQDWTAKGGLFRSDKSGRNLLDLDPALKESVSGAARALLDNITGMARGLGLNTGKLAGTRASVNRALTGNEADDQKVINDILSQYETALASNFSRVLDPFKRMGESLVQTMERLTVLGQLSEQMNSLGGIFSKVATSSLQARENIISLAGGIDELMKKAGAFVRDYYTQGEQAGMQAKAVLEAFRQLGVDGSAIQSRDDFRKLVESVNVNTEQGQKQLVTLLDIAPEFAGLADYLKQQGQTLAEVALQAPATAIMDALVPEQKRAGDSLANIGASIISGNATLGVIANSIQSGNTSIATGLRLMQQATENQNATLRSLIDRVIDRVNALATPPNYQYDLGGR